MGCHLDSNKRDAGVRLRLHPVTSCMLPRRGARPSPHSLAARYCSSTRVPSSHKAVYYSAEGDDGLPCKLGLAERCARASAGHYLYPPLDSSHCRSLCHSATDMPVSEFNVQSQAQLAALLLYRYECRPQYESWAPQCTPSNKGVLLAWP